MAGDQRARRGHADEHGLVPVADRRRRLLAQRGVRLVADDDRVGVRDVARVAHEPLVGLDGHRAVGAVLAAHQRRRDALGVAAVAQLAEELVDEVAPVGEDQRAAGLRALDEAERGDGLAGAGRVLEPEALRGVRVLGRLGELLLVVRVRGGVVLPVLRLLGLVLVVELLLAGDRRRTRAAAAGSASGAAPLALAPLPDSASSAVSVPDSASTWWAESTVPSTSLGSSWLSRRSSPSSSDQRWRHATDGTLAPAVELRERGVERTAARRAGRERGGAVLPVEHERLAGERRGAVDRVLGRDGDGRRGLDGH